MTRWPQDADGDVLRRMRAADFDFSRSYCIDFNVDFESWPPVPAALEIIRANWSEPRLFPSEEGDDGYVQFYVSAPVSYELVTDVQRRATRLLREFGGRCESWGVMQDP